MTCINQDLPATYHANAASSMPYKRYTPWCEYTQGLPVDDKWRARSWPNRKLLRAPRWCSVDLRDGNQALVNPMDATKKLEYFRTLAKMGFKEIEIGFPSASKLDFDFARVLIETEQFPDDVWLMVLVQAREHLIRQTIEALKGAKKVIIHLYNSTSELQRRVVFGLGKEEVKNMAVEGTRLIRSLSNEVLIAGGTSVRFQYSPESFTGTEIQFALETCHAVMDVWGPSVSDPIVLNLPETVQNAGPHFYADQIEWMHCHLKEREKVLISLHPHNDRGTGVSSAELAMMAGADRVEGCLFGNGERTGNVCLVTLAVNFLHHGIDPEMDLSDVPSIKKMFERCTEMKVPERHPWAGSLVYTAFSGSHQDAIKKGMALMKKRIDENQAQRASSEKKNGENKKEENKSQGELVPWEVPYLPIDPADLGCSYEAIVRINSQSGKGGVAFIMETEFGVCMPRSMQIEFSQEVQAWCDKTAKEVEPKAIWSLFESAYLKQRTPLALNAYRIISQASHAKDNFGKKRMRSLAEDKGSPTDIQPSKKDFRPLEGLAQATQITQASQTSQNFNEQLSTQSEVQPVAATQVVAAQGVLSDVDSTEDASVVTCVSDSRPSTIDEIPQLPPSLSEADICTQMERAQIKTDSPGAEGSEWLVVDRPNLSDSENSSGAEDQVIIEAHLMADGVPVEISGIGNGPMHAFLMAVNAWTDKSAPPAIGCLKNLEISHYQEESTGTGSAAEAICFVALQSAGQPGKSKSANKKSDVRWGAARHTNTTTASLNAICCAINRLSR